jgi:hypothetical protein
MANTLNKTGITSGNTVEAYHVTQSIDAFTGTVAYDISLSGSLGVTGPLTVTGPTTISGSQISLTGQLVGNLTTDKVGIVDLSGLVGGGFTGKLVLPSGAPTNPTSGTVYWDEASNRLYVYSSTTSTFVQI